MNYEMHETAPGYPGRSSAATSGIDTPHCRWVGKSEPPRGQLTPGDQWGSRVTGPFLTWDGEGWVALPHSCAMCEPGGIYGDPL